MEFAKRTRLDKGWSADRKYRVESESGRSYLLREADISEYPRKRREFEAMRAFAETGIPMAQPLTLSISPDQKRVCTLLTWAEGEDAETYLARVGEDAQYALGQMAGRILKRMHTIPASSAQEDWETHFFHKTLRRLDAFRASGYSFPGDQAMIDFLTHHQDAYENRPQVLQHGDFHAGNLIVSARGEITVIDFNRVDYGDPWSEFDRIGFDVRIAPAFARGRLDGYFDGRPPAAFFHALAVYVTSAALGAVSWAVPFGETEIRVMEEMAQDVVRWYDGMRRQIPDWYEA